MNSDRVLVGAANNIIQIDVIVPNQTRYLRLIGEMGENIAKELDQYTGDREALAYHLNLALTEAMINAIQHGHSSDPRQTVQVTIRILEDKLCIEVYDQGQGFDLDSIPFPDLDHPTECGRGIFLIKSIMDCVCYRKTKRGNVLEMRKRLA